MRLAVLALCAAVISAGVLAGALARAEGPTRLPEAHPTESEAPRYPGRALHAQKYGIAVIGITIGADGLVTDAEVLAEKPAGWSFGAEAMRAVKRWEFKTTPPGRYQVTLTFSP